MKSNEQERKAKYYEDNKDSIKQKRRERYMRRKNSESIDEEEYLKRKNRDMEEQNE